MPWGNKFRCHKPDEKRFGGSCSDALPGIRREEGTAEKIAALLPEGDVDPAEVEKKKGVRAPRFLWARHQHLIFNEIDGELPAYDGHHIQIYVVNFSAPHRHLNDRGLVFEESDQYQYRFKQLVDPDSNERFYELEHEVRSVTASALREYDGESQPCADEPRLPAEPRLMPWGLARRRDGAVVRTAARETARQGKGSPRDRHRRISRRVVRRQHLRQVCGWEVDLFEGVDDDLASRGGGYRDAREMFDVLRHLGLPVDESFGIDVTRRICFGKSGDKRLRIPMRRKMSAWSRFYRPLKDSFTQDAITSR